MSDLGTQPPFTYDPPRLSWENLDAHLKQRTQEWSTALHAHIEMMAAAYYQKTQIPPDEVVLVQKQTNTADGWTITWYFRRRDSDK